ncbi:MAG: molybdenum cofactor guanylyltransferase [Gammaproteobacteria bacterium]
MSDVNELMQRVTAILLTGGASSRMGTDKAMLDWHGRPLWRYVQDVLARAGCRQVLVSGTPADLIDGESATPDVTPGLGPLAGIASVIGAQGDALSKDWLLVVPVDLPQLSPEVLRWLCVQGFDAPGAHYAGHALPGLFRNTIGFRQALGTALRAAEGRERSATALHAAVGSQAIALPPALAPALTNTNTPHEWVAAGGASLH